MTQNARTVMGILGFDPADRACCVGDADALAGFGAVGKVDRSLRMHAVFGGDSDETLLAEVLAGCPELGGVASLPAVFDSIQITPSKRIAS